MFTVVYNDIEFKFKREDIKDNQDIKFLQAVINFDEIQIIELVPEQRISNNIEYLYICELFEFLIERKHHMLFRTIHNLPKSIEYLFTKSSDELLKFLHVNDVQIAILHDMNGNFKNNPHFVINTPEIRYTLSDHLSNNAKKLKKLKKLKADHLNLDLTTTTIPKFLLAITNVEHIIKMTMNKSKTNLHNFAIEILKDFISVILDDPDTYSELISTELAYSIFSVMGFITNFIDYNKDILMFLCLLHFDSPIYDDNFKNDILSQIQSKIGDSSSFVEILKFFDLY